MKTFKLLLALLAVAFLAAGPAHAGGYTTAVGGIDLVLTLTGTSTSGPAEVTWTTPTNFTPDYIECVNELDGNPDIYKWFHGMISTSSVYVAQASGIVTYTSTGGGGCGFTVAAGSIKIAAACQQASEDYSCIAVRYTH